jgi:hypothetical protein
MMLPATNYFLLRSNRKGSLESHERQKIAAVLSEAMRFFSQRIASDVWVRWRRFAAVTGHRVYKLTP